MKAVHVHLRLMVLLFMYLFHVSERDVSLEDCRTFFFTGEGEGAALPATINVEEACALAGGICLPEKECPTGHLSPKRGLCPLQQEAGVECCHGRTFETRYESSFNQNFVDCKMLKTKSDNGNISRNWPSQSIK